MTSFRKKQPRVFRSETVSWSEVDGHIQGVLSKLLINPNNSDSAHLDIRLSSFQPGGLIQPHVHENSENVYYILQGNGVAILDGERHFVGPHTMIFIPPGVVHAIENTGIENLLYLFVAAPPNDHIQQWGNQDSLP